MSEEIRKEIIEIFLICEHHEKLEKAIRKVFGWSQREMAARLLTSQCYISMWERGCLTKEGEEERLYFNLRCELEERTYEVDNYFGSTGLDSVLILIHVIHTYLDMVKIPFTLPSKDRRDLQIHLSYLSGVLKERVDKTLGR